MSGLRPGGLALVIGCRQDPRNIGKRVELLALLQPGETFRTWTDWEFRNSDSVPLWACYREEGLIGYWLSLEGERLLQSTPFGLFLPQHLMPLDDDEEGQRRAQMAKPEEEVPF